MDRQNLFEFVNELYTNMIHAMLGVYSHVIISKIFSGGIIPKLFHIYRMASTWEAGKFSADQDLMIFQNIADLWGLLHKNEKNVKILSTAKENWLKLKNRSIERVKNHLSQKIKEYKGPLPNVENNEQIGFLKMLQTILFGMMYELSIQETLDIPVEEWEGFSLYTPEHFLDLFTFYMYAEEAYRNMKDNKLVWKVIFDEYNLMNFIAGNRYEKIFKDFVPKLEKLDAGIKETFHKYL